MFKANAQKKVKRKVKWSFERTDMPVSGILSRKKDESKTFYNICK